jgi:hypothetical protein
MPSLLCQSEKKIYSAGKIFYCVVQKNDRVYGRVLEELNILKKDVTQVISVIRVMSLNNRTFS